MEVENAGSTCIANYVRSSSIHLIHISTTNSYNNFILSSVVTWAVASNAGAFLSSRTLLKISATVYSGKFQTLLNTSNTLYRTLVCSSNINWWKWKCKLINAHLFSFFGFFPEQTIVLTKATSEMYNRLKDYKLYNCLRLLVTYVRIMCLLEVLEYIPDCPC